MKLTKHITTTMQSIALGMILVACGSAKSLQTATSAPEATANATLTNSKYMATVASNNSDQSNITAKVKVVVDVDGKATSTSGSLKMKRDDVIQISLVDPILGAVELGRIEFTKTNVLIIDRVNKQYIDVPYSSVSFLKKANIDFNSLQSLFWHEVFEPGKPKATPEHFTLSDIGGKVDLVYIDKMLTYRFGTTKESGLLNETNVMDNNDKAYAFNFAYRNFIQFEGKSFPKDMTMSFTMGGQTTSLSLSISSMKNSADWSTRTAAPSKYTKADPEKIFKNLVK